MLNIGDRVWMPDECRYRGQTGTLVGYWERPSDGVLLAKIQTDCGDRIVWYLDRLVRV